MANQSQGWQEVRRVPGWLTLRPPGIPTGRMAAGRDGNIRSPSCGAGREGGKESLQGHLVQPLPRQGHQATSNGGGGALGPGLKENLLLQPQTDHSSPTGRLRKSPHFCNPRMGPSLDLWSGSPLPLLSACPTAPVAPSPSFWTGQPLTYPHGGVLSLLVVCCLERGQRKRDSGGRAGWLWGGAPPFGHTFPLLWPQQAAKGPSGVRPEASSIKQMSTL